MTRRPTNFVENHRPYVVSNQMQHKKRHQVMRYRKKVPDPPLSPVGNNFQDDESDTASPDNQSSRTCIKYYFPLLNITGLDESSPVKVHPIPTSSNVYVVNVQDFRFHPEHIVIERYSTIRWQIPADSNTVYSITISSAHSTNSPTLSQDNPTFEHTFDTLGTYAYSCSLYSFMNGTITVVATLSAEEMSRNMCFLDYPLPKKPSKILSPTSLAMYPFQKQLVVWREKQAPRESHEDDDTFAKKSRERIKKKAQKVAMNGLKPKPISTPTIETTTESLPELDNASLVEPVAPSVPCTHQVRIEDFAFSALPSRPVVGDTISWHVSSDSPGMVEHALRLRVVSHDGAVEQTLQSSTLKPGDHWSCLVLQPCTLYVECDVYHIKSEVVVAAPTPVILIGDVACPVDDASISTPSSPLSKPASPVVADSTDQPQPSIIQLFHKSKLKQKAMRSSYLIPDKERAKTGLIGFDAAATYDFLKRRAQEIKQDVHVVYACCRQV
ncbi:unnamed protein product [Aphanomyces euteiches]